VRPTDETSEDTSVEALVATILSMRSPRARDHIDVANDLLASWGGLAGLACADVSELEERLVLAHVPRSKRAAGALVAAFELGRRVTRAEAIPAARITRSEDAAAWGMARLGALTHEELWMLALDGRSRLRAARCVAKGGLHGIGVQVADPLRYALRTGATGFVLVHNHPSGDPTPSPQDITFTREIARAAGVVGVPLLDHVVVTREGFEIVPSGEGEAA
jgi:DNA repair protein RadC